MGTRVRARSGAPNVTLGPPSPNQSRLQQMIAHATSTKAKNRPESRSQRTCSRLKQLNHDSDRSTRQRWRPSRVDDSTPRRAIRDLIPRRRSQTRLAALSYPLSAWTLCGRTRRRPDGVRTGGMSSTTAWNIVVSATLAAVTTAVSGSPPPSQTRWSLLPGLPRSTGFAPTWSPHAWPARWPSPRSRASSPGAPARRAGPGPPGGAPRTRLPWPTRPAAATPSPASHSQARGLGAAARGWRFEPCRRSRPSSCDH
jgi:hypothetical protein